MRTSLLTTGPVVAISLLLSACASDGGTPAGPATPSPSASPSATASPPEIPEDPTAPAGQCADDALRVTIEPHPEGNSAGHVISLVAFTNIGSTACELQGAPAVAVVDAAGTVIGTGAVQLDWPEPPTITLEPGGRAVAGLSAADIDADGGPLGDECPTVAGAAYLVHPPHSWTPVQVPAAVPACDSEISWMTVTAVRAG